MLGFEKFKFWKKEPEAVNRVPEMAAFTSNRLSNPIFSISFDGEKTPGEIGVIKDYKPDYFALRARSWQSFYESEITQTVIKKYVLWVIGNGLKLQSEPMTSILDEVGVNFDKEKFTKQVEARWKLWSQSEDSDYTKNATFNKVSAEAEFNAVIGGDVLVIQRVEDTGISEQLIDGSHIKTPFDFNFNKSTENGNRVIDGVEINSRGQHVKYHFEKEDGTFGEIEARDKSGRKIAFLVYGSKYRINDVRGMPLIGAVLQALKVLDRYKEATVASAEELAKVVYTVEHDQNSTGEAPLSNLVQSSMNNGSTVDDSHTLANAVCQDINFTSQKQVYNMPVGAKVKAIDSKTELYFKDFYDANFDLICSAINIPPDVAKSMYNSSYSASRAAIMDWAHVLKVNRKAFSDQFYVPIYSLWLDHQVLTFKINAPGYLEALTSNNKEVLGSYKNARFVGANVPHIDPLKEVKAERAKLGSLSDHMPLTTVEAATEALDGGDSDSNMEQYQNELLQFPAPVEEEAMPPSS